MNIATLLADMLDVSANGVPFTVVSAKVPGEFIVRGIKKFSSPEAVRSKMQPFVLIVDSEIEWTFHTYFMPHYLAYGSGDIPKLGWIGTDGVYLHRCVRQPDKNGEHDAYGEGKKLEAW